MSRLLVIGYGVITKGIIKNVYQKAKDIEITVLSRHMKELEEGKVINKVCNLGNEYDYIITCFEDHITASEFWSNEKTEEIISNSKSVCIEMSTLNLTSINSWFNRIKSIGGIPVESPFTGSREGSKNGKLSLFIFKEKLSKEDEERIEKIINLYSEKVYRFSKLGNPTKFKLLYNAWGAMLLYSIKEFNPKKLGMGEDENICNDIISNDGWMSLVCKSKLEVINNEEFDDIHFKLKYMIKDLNYAYEDIFKNLNMPMFNVIKKEYDKGKANLDKDYTIISKLEVM